MSATLTARNYLERGTGAFLHYLHIDLATVGLALTFVVAGGLAANISLFAASDAVRPYFAGPVATPPAIPGTERAPQRLAPAMAAALDQVAQRYRVSAEALQPVFEAAQTAGLGGQRRQRSVLPLLACHSGDQHRAAAACPGVGVGEAHAFDLVASHRGCPPFGALVDSGHVSKGTRGHRRKRRRNRSGPHDGLPGSLKGSYERICR